MQRPSCQCLHRSDTPATASFIPAVLVSMCTYRARPRLLVQQHFGADRRPIHIITHCFCNRCSWTHGTCPRCRRGTARTPRRSRAHCILYDCIQSIHDQQHTGVHYPMHADKHLAADSHLLLPTPLDQRLWWGGLPATAAAAPHLVASAHEDHRGAHFCRCARRGCMGNRAGVCHKARYPVVRGSSH